MENTVSQYLNGMGSGIDEAALGPIVKALADRLSSQVFNAAGLAIATTTSRIRTTNLTKFMAGGIYGTVAGTDNAIVLGADCNMIANQFLVVVVYVDALGALSYKASSAAASLAACKWPSTPVGKAIVGFVTIGSGAGTFTGGTTALTGGTVTVTYTDTLGAFDPSVLIG